MQFLRTLFWVVFAVVAAVFAMNNWEPPVQVKLWNFLVLETRLPLLLLVAFLLGLLPGVVLHRTTRWRLRRRLDTAERSLADLRPPAVTPDPVVITPAADPLP